MTCMKLLLALMFCASSVVAQGGGSLKTGTAAVPHVPEKGSVERKTIVDALRAPVEKRLKQPVIFKIDHLKVLMLIGTKNTAHRRGSSYNRAGVSMLGRRSWWECRLIEPTHKTGYKTKYQITPQGGSGFSLEFIKL